MKGNLCYKSNFWIPFRPCECDANHSYFKPRLFFLQVSEFNEFEPRLKSAINRFQLSAGLNLEKLNSILSGTNHI